jgi:hypothetical protein
LSAQPEQGPSSGDAEADEEIKRLLALPPVLYERARAKAAEKLGMRVSILDRLVEAARKSGGDGNETQG